MSTPVIAVVGRPNVGKSTIFNRIVGEGEWLGHSFNIIDTGGIDITDEPFMSNIRMQAEIAMEEADVIIFLTSVKEGVTTTDEHIAKLLYRTNKPVLLAVNKVDNPELRSEIFDFYALGFGEPFPISGSHGLGLGDLLDAAVKAFPEDKGDEEDKDVIKFSFIGRPNVGKSTLTNRILGEDRVVVYDMPGTTRDSIYIPMERDGQNYTLIDTAGVRKRGKVHLAVEKFSVIKTLQAIQDANVVLLVIDARENISDQDLSLLGFILNAGRSLVIVVNKWDGLDTDVKDRVKSELDRRLDFIDFARVHFISALHGSGVGNLFDSVKEAYECATQKMTTSLLTRILQIAVDEHQPPMISCRRVKLKYAHPGGYNPPIIVIHGNQVDKLPDSYKRYLSNHFRRSLKIIGSPIRLQFQEGNNPFAGRRNKLTPNQLRKRKRLMKFIKKSKR